jgi:hypothetical protein
MTTSAEPARPAGPTSLPRPRRWRRRLVLLVLVLLSPAIPTAVWVYFRMSEEQSAQQALAETDRLDPRWRFAEILAGRPPIPDTENGSLQVIKTMKVYGKSSFHYSGPEFDAIEKLPPTSRLTAEQAVWLRELLDGCPEAVAEARKLKDFPMGRPPIKYAPDFISTLVEPVQQARDVCTMLHCDAVRLAEDGDADGAVQSCRAMLNAARSVGDEPFLVALMVRFACLHQMLDALERVLARGEPAAAELAALQAGLERELTEPTLVVALRGERAGLYEVLVQMGEGKIRPSYLAAISGAKQSPWVRWVQDYIPASAGVDRAAFLRMMNESVEAAKLPVEKQASEFEGIHQTWKDEITQPPGALKWMQNTIKSHFRTQANLRCAIAALATERYRLKHGRWPESLDVLVQTGLLATVPLDPFDGQRVRFKRLPDGVVVYSIGLDRNDNGAVIDRHYDAPAGTDLGLRLWDPAARHKE